MYTLSRRIIYNRVLVVVAVNSRIYRSSWRRDAPECLRGLLANHRRAKQFQECPPVAPSPAKAIPCRQLIFVTPELSKLGRQTFDQSIRFN